MLAVYFNAPRIPPGRRRRHFSFSVSRRATPLVVIIVVVASCHL
jgi:hypothetical protein